MRLFIAVSWFDKIGGVERQAVVTAVELKKLGHQVSVFCKTPVDEKNQYIIALRQAGIGIFACPRWLAKVSSDWYTQDHIVKFLSWLVSPILFIIALIATVLKQKSFVKMWSSVFGRSRQELGNRIRKDRLDDVLLGNLSLFQMLLKPDVVHIFRPDLHYVMAWAERKKMASVYYELSVPTHDMRQSYETWQRMQENLNKATIVIAISQATANALRKMSINRPIEVIYPGMFDVPELTEEKQKKSNTPITITCIARLAYDKGISFLLQAASELLVTHPNVLFVLAGDGPLKESLMKQAKDLGIEEKVHFYGPFPKNDLPKIMEMTDIKVLPSISEAFGIVMIEAMAYAKPVVASRVDGIPEVVEDGITGFLCEPGNPSDLAKKLLMLIDNEQLRREMGQAGREAIVAGKFSVGEYIKSTIKVYEMAIQKKAQ